MSLADELLATMGEDVYSHEHIMSDPDSYFVIDPDSREIINSSRERIVIMQFDHNSEIFTFEIPRYIEGHDMLLCNRVRVHFDNVDGTTNEERQDVAEMYDLATSKEDPSKVISTWCIRREATQLAGTLNFLVQYECIDDNGKSVYEWHTDIFTEVDVKAGRNFGEQAVIEYSNVLEQWYQKLFGTGESIVANISDVAEEKLAVIEAEGTKQIANVNAAGVSQISTIEAKGVETLATIPEDYTTTYNMAEEALRRKANVIEMNAEGESIYVEDSADAYLLGLNLYGKTTQVSTTGAQLIPFPYFNSDKALNGVTWKINDDGSITATGSATSTSQLYFTNSYFEMIAGTYTISGSTSEITVRIDASNRSTGAWAKGVAISKDGEPVTFTLTDADIENYTFTVYATVDSDVGSDKTAYPMLNTGSIALPYELYSGGVASPSPKCPQELASVENAMIRFSNKNLFKLSGETITHSGITFTVNDDGTITANGTATDLAYVNYTVKLCKGEYILTGCYAGGHDANYFIRLVASGITLGNEYGDGLRFTMNKTDTVTVRIAIRSGITLDHAVFAPMIRLASVNSTEFEAGVDPQLLYALYTLPGIPVTTGGNYIDSNDRQWICDEIDFERGVYVQRVQRYELSGTEEWMVSGVQSGLKEGFTRYDCAVISPRTLLTDSLWSHFPYKGTYVTDGYGAWVLNATDTITALRIVTDCATVDELKAFLSEAGESGNPVVVYYPLASPIETPLTDEEIANFKMVRTNYHNTTVVNDSGCHMAIKYAADTRMFFENHSIATNSQVETAVDAWLTKYFSSAEEVGF